MALEYFCAYNSYLDAMEPLTDAERGRLFVACLEYSKSGTTRHLSGNERFLFPMMRAQIDRDNAKYKSKCKKQSDNVSKRWNTGDTNVYDGIEEIPPYKNDTNDTKEKEKEKEKEKAKEKAKEKEKGKENISSLSLSADVSDDFARASRRSPASEIDFSAYSFSPALRGKLSAWFAYKQERRQGYTAQQKHALLQTVEQKLSSYPEASIIALVDQCMVAGWKNIIFERLDKPGAVPQSTGFRHAADPDFQAAVRRMAGGDAP